ncbi:BLUF domain-containing protein [Aquimarina sp. 2201CG5-10]|uniref:BLUF domain-containing protein n=1 Tax=Aquimarina callyspongiae TaxID=3098150 RepID=UPI002AB371DF|nr:BLUF domain-containing protein [Aquimarina sp. 2201CG5-10]MDY8138829.1 BLUF domain-containing protein [Aquimarina sp. 2201CG5-10]
MRCAISYVSTANRYLLDSEIADLMEFVELYNNTSGITGILIYSDGNFFQVLEGETELVHSLFNKIKCDPRHHNIIKILDDTICESSFTKYHSFFTINQDNRGNKELQSFLNSEKTNNPDYFKSISYLTKKFMKLS